LLEVFMSLTNYRVFDRRSFMKVAIGSGIAVSGLPLARAEPAQLRLKAYPFTLGVASGEPASDGFVIWTRLAPEPLRGHGGMPPDPVGVAWQIGADAEMKTILRAGTAVARVETAHSVHVEVGGLESERPYFYRFRVGDIDSPIGRAKTLAAAGVDMTELKFAVAGCQSWEDGFYTAWRRIAEEDLDFVFHYGDYIYEYARRRPATGGRLLAREMPDDFPTCINVVDYRRRYSLYKSDPDLQAAHASCTFLSSFDDHEVTNNWAGESDPRNTPSEEFLLRRAAAFQAWYEHMPVRRAVLPRGPDMLTYRNFRFGRLANLAALDTRQFRSHQPCGDDIKANCIEARNPARTIMGQTQENWLAASLRSSGATWQVLAQQVMFSHMDWRSFSWARTSEPDAGYMDGWDGYVASRDQVLGMVREGQIANWLVLTGDAHMGLALDIKEDWRHSGSRPVGVEFLATSISSGGDGGVLLANDAALRADNPHLRFASNERGYNRHVVTSKQWRADFRVVERVSAVGASAVTRKSFIVEAGRPGLVDA
jgi:alkaline phosphatase D